MSDRRQETRRRFTAFTPVYDLYPRTLLGYLGDLNMRGALIIGKNLTTIKKDTVPEIIFPGELAEIKVLPIPIPARPPKPRRSSMFELRPWSFHSMAVPRVGSATEKARIRPSSPC